MVSVAASYESEQDQLVCWAYVMVGREVPGGTVGWGGEAL